MQNIERWADNEEEKLKALAVIELLEPCLKKSRHNKIKDDAHYMTGFGTKSAIGLYRCLERIISE